METEEKKESDPQEKTLPEFSTSYPEELAQDADRMRRAKIIKFFPQYGYGFVLDQLGHEIYFHTEEVRFIGLKRDKTLVREGLQVGIDVGLSSRGLRVTHIRL